MTSETTLVEACLEAEKRLSGKWFAIKEGRIVAVATSNRALWTKIKRLGVHDVLLGYAPTKKEKEAEFLYTTFGKTRCSRDG